MLIRRKMIKYIYELIVYLLLFINLFGCGTQEKNIILGQTIDKIIISCREYLESGNSEEKGYGLYSYIIIPWKPINQKEFERYLELYHAYLLLKESKAIPYKDYKLDKTNINITYWLVTSKDYYLNIENDKYFIANYDYIGAELIIKTKFANLSNPGPFIISSHFPLHSIKDNPDKKEILILDLSRIDQSLFKDIMYYFDYIVIKDPETWKNKFDWEFIRIHFLSAISVHGKPVLHAAEWFGDKFNVKGALASPK